MNTLEFEIIFAGELANEPIQFVTCLAHGLRRVWCHANHNADGLDIFFTEAVDAAIL